MMEYERKMSPGEAWAKIIGAIALLVPIATLRGWVLSKLWLWFVAPLGVPAIGLAQAIGLCFIVGMFLMKQPKDSDQIHLGKFFTFALTTSLFTLLPGWIVSLFMA